MDFQKQYRGGKMEIKEEWRPIKGYEGLYEVSNFGRVKSLSRKVRAGKNKIRTVNERILKPYKSKFGYLVVKSSPKNGSKHFAIHRIVAQAFIPNPNNYPDVNHKDERKDNNIVSNLEWCNHSYNALYGTCQQRLLKHKQKAVEMVDTKTNEVVRVFDSMKNAGEELNIAKEQISAVCRGIRKTAGGYSWRYANGNNR